MVNWPKPTVIISKCIEFDHCRYDGSMISSTFVEKIKPFVNFLPVCPEVEIGLGIPRKSLRLVQTNDTIHLIQPATSKDVTEQMITFANSFLSNQQPVQGVILKSRSPSCGIKDVKLYATSKNAAPVEKTAGLFGGQILQQLNCNIESEGRLRNTFIQEHFLVSIFTLADFEQLKKKNSISDLVSFHSKNKFLIMAYNQEILHKLGRIVANQKKENLKQVLDQYEYLLKLVFNTSPSHKTTTNVLLHLFGFVSDKLSKSEKEFFLDLLQKYRNEKLPLTVITHVLKSWIIRFGEPYLSNQTFFSPFPEELMNKDVSVIADQQRYWE